MAAASASIAAAQAGPADYPRWVSPFLSYDLQAWHQPLRASLLLSIGRSPAAATAAAYFFFYFSEREVTGEGTEGQAHTGAKQGDPQGKNTSRTQRTESKAKPARAERNTATTTSQNRKQGEGQTNQAANKSTPPRRKQGALDSTRREAGKKGKREKKRP
jgi:hypothetical protein